MSPLRLVPSEPAPVPAPRAYEPPAQIRRLPTSAFAAHERRLAPSRAHPDRVPAPPGGRAHVTCSWDDLDLEEGLLTAMEHLARGRALQDELGRPFPLHDTQRCSGRRAAELAGMAARLRPHLKAGHPWAGLAATIVERLAVEEQHWWGLSGRKF